MPAPDPNNVERSTRWKGGAERPVNASIVGKSALAARVGGLLAIGFEGTTIDDAPAEVIGGMAGAVLFRRNLRSAEQTKALTADLQSTVTGGAPPLLIAIDEEGGTVSRIAGIGTRMPSAMALGAVDDPSLTEAVYAAIGAELAALGVTFDFAPVADVNSNARNPVIGVRSFGDNPARVGEHVAASIRGLHSAGVGSAAKHFPGHGDAVADSHLELPVIPLLLDRLRAVELVPFAAAVAQGVDAVMIAHVWFPALDSAPTPASMSRRVVAGLLREELGFEGVVCTDCLQMAAVTRSHGPGEAAVRAIAAGADLLLFSSSLEAATAARDALADAVRAGTLDAPSVALSLDRVERLRARSRSNGTHSLASVGSTEHRKRAVDAAQRSITLVRDPHKFVPLSVSREQSILIVVFGGVTTTLAAALRVSYARIDELTADEDPADEFAREAVEVASRSAAIMCVTYRASLHPLQARLVDELARLGKPVIVVAACEPYDADSVPPHVAVLAAYGDDPAAISAVAAVIVGAATAGGRLPVSLAKAVR